LQAQADNEPRQDVRPAIPALPKPVTKKPEPKAPPKIVAPKVNEHPKPATANNRAAMQYWKRVAQRFEQQEKMLNQETDPARRMNLIRTMARNVRIDTPSTLEWAMNLDNPKERQMAMESINDNALAGIGARLEMDETGLPRIRETTVLSAVASTGSVEPGDYIAAW